MIAESASLARCPKDFRLMRGPRREWRSHASAWPAIAPDVACPRWRLKLQLRSHYFTLSLLIFLHLIVHLSHVAVLYLSDPLLSFHLVVSAGPNCSEISP